MCTLHYLDPDILYLSAKFHRMTQNFLCYLAHFWQHQVFSQNFQIFVFLPQGSQMAKSAKSKVHYGCIEFLTKGNSSWKNYLNLTLNLTLKPTGCRTNEDGDPGNHTWHKHCKEIFTQHNTTYFSAWEDQGGVGKAHNPRLLCRCVWTRSQGWVTGELWVSVNTSEVLSWA